MNNPTRCTCLSLAFFVTLAGVARAQSVTDPHITSWRTANSAQYARVYESAAKFSSGTTNTTWPSSGLVTNPAGGVSTATYSDVQRVAYSSTYVYIYTTGLASYTMGNWLTPNGTTYTSFPSNRAAIHRIPRTPSIPTTKQANHGSGGVLVNGVFVWENGDAQSYSTSGSTANSATISMQGDGIWNRLAGVAETFNFDPANGHQPSNGAYHNHINPKALRYQLGDAVTYNASTKTYSEGTPTKHSPIIGWANDGLPIYGPYGYSSPMDSSSAVRRMTTGFQKRDGTNGTDNLASTGRVKLPVWAASVQGKSQTLSASEYGPSTTATYALGPVTKTCVIGTFAEDYEYLGDLGKTQGTDFDLNRQNVRFCVTPEFPSGTYAYFVCIDSSGNTVFPDVINQEYFGTAPQGQGTVNSITESVTDYADAGPAAPITITATASGNNVALAWNSAEGATYKAESSSDNSTWTTLSSTITSGGLTTNYTATGNTNYYRVTLTAIASYDTGGTFGTPVGKTATVTFGNVATAPGITTQPANVTVTAGTSATFTVVASGTAPLTYQWSKGGAAISGATSASYTIASPQTTDAGSYTVTVTNSAGSATSNAATLTVNNGGGGATAPSIATQPASATVIVGGSVSFTVAANGTAPLSYQWRKDGTSISGATAASYSIASVQATDAAGYTCVVTNSAGSATSSTATLTVTTTAVAPAITTQPVNATANVGGTVTFSVLATGTSPLSYQWRKDGSAIAGATSASYTIATVQAGDAGSYTVVVTNSTGNVTSSAATLTVAAGAVTPTIATQPVGVTTAVGGSATFALTANGTAPLTYQWRKDGGTINGATFASYTISSAQTTDAGAYSCVVTNSAGSVTSNATALTVTSSSGAPSITSQPASLAINAGTSATFSVTAGGAAPLSYQWRKSGAPIAGATSSSYTIATAQVADSGSYTVVVSNNIGSVTSSAATLTVNAVATARIVNLAVRTRVGGVAGAPTVGFVMNGAGAGKRIVVRAVGPTLGAFGVAGTLADPRLQLWSNGAMLLNNDNWVATDAPAFAAVGAFPLNAGSADAAIVTTLAPGAYTTPLSFAEGTSGIVLIECYDGAPADTSARLINASALAYVGTGDDVLIPGFVISGEGTVRILVRAIGPGLGQFGLTGALAEPRLSLFRDATLFGLNAGWSTSANAAEIASAASSVGAFALANGSKDAALLVSLSAGAYSATVSGNTGGTGPALVEVYVVP